MSVRDRIVKVREKAESLRSDAGQNHAAIPGFAAAGDQGTFFEAVEQASNVGIASDHAVPDLAARQPLRRTAQDAQHVVLRGRDISRPQHVINAAGKDIGGAMKGQEDVLFQAADAAAGARLFGLLRHIGHNSRYNDYCQTSGKQVLHGNGRWGSRSGDQRALWNVSTTIEDGQQKVDDRGRPPLIIERYGDLSTAKGWRDNQQYGAS